MPEHNTQKLRVSFSLSVHKFCSCNAIFNSFSFNTTPFSFQPQSFSKFDSSHTATVNYLVNNIWCKHSDEKEMLKLYWQVWITLPLFQMARGIWPFHDLSAVKTWPMCTASHCQCVWVRAFRQGTKSFSKSLVNSNIVSKIKKKWRPYSRNLKTFSSHKSALSDNNLMTWEF